MPFLGCIIAFAVEKRQHPHGFTPKARKLLIAAGILYISMFLAAFIWYFTMTPLAYREWLRSFDRDWDKKKGSWWSTYVWADGHLDDWAAQVFKDGWNWLRLRFVRKRSRTSGET
jgi:hypothetical protein